MDDPPAMEALPDECSAPADSPAVDSMADCRAAADSSLDGSVAQTMADPSVMAVPRADCLALADWLAVALMADSLAVADSLLGDWAA
jgi:hypothetical protein